MSRGVLDLNTYEELWSVGRKGSADSEVCNGSVAPYRETISFFCRQSSKDVIKDVKVSFTITLADDTRLLKEVLSDDSSLDRETVVEAKVEVSSET